MKPDISVIIITNNRKDDLGHCIDALLSQSYPSKKFEIIIIDSWSTDGTEEMVKKYGMAIKFIISSQKGYSACRNLGFRKSRAEIVAFTDSDCIPAKNWVKTIIEDFKHSGKEIVAIGGPTKVSAGKCLIARVSQQIVNDSVSGLRKGSSAFFMTTTNLALRKNIVRIIGPFDRRYDFETGEDTEFCWRIVKSGLKLRYNSSIVVDHSQRSSIRGFLKQHYNYGRGIYLVKKKHPDFMQGLKTQNRFKRYFEEAFIFPVVFTKHFKKTEKPAAFLLAFSRQLAFFAGIASAKIKYSSK